MIRPTRPNVLFILPDQLRPDFLGCYGAHFLRTPNIDALAARGLRFETAISPSPICVPARASMLTGLDALAHGVIDNNRWLRPDRAKMGIRTWPELLADAGYHTAAIGKMHFCPWDASEGFETRHVAEDKRHTKIADDYADYLSKKGARKLHGRELRNYTDSQGAAFNDLPEDWHVDKWTADQAIQFINRYDEDRPFAMMVGFPSPHCPYDPAEAAVASIVPSKLPLPLPPTKESARHQKRIIESYKRSWAGLDLSTLHPENVRQIRRHYAALVEGIDREVGRVLAALREAGQRDNTVVIFASDHGDYLGDFDLLGKSLFHEPSIRVPLIIHDPRRSGCGAVRRNPVSIVNIFSTILDAAGLAHTRDAAELSLLREGADSPIFGATSDGMMVRSKDWKLVQYPDGSGALFHLAEDPHELVDLWSEPTAADIRQALGATLIENVFRGLRKAHEDKRVSTKDLAFYRRGWHRAYPFPG